MFGGDDDYGITLADITVLQFSEWCGVCRMCADEGGEEGKCGKGEIGRRVGTGGMRRSGREGSRSCDELLALPYISK